MSEVTTAGPAKPLRELLPHLIWEAVLLLAAIGLIVAVSAKSTGAVTADSSWGQLAVAGFVAMGLALSLRTGTPNLAVGQIAAVAAWVHADKDSAPLAILVAVGLGLLLAGITGLTSLPAWAVTLIGGYGMLAVMAGVSEGKLATYRSAGTPAMLTFVVLFVLLSVGGGVLFAVPPVRRALTANRAGIGEPGAFSVAKLLGALVGVAGSSVLAGIGGVVLTWNLRAAQPYDSGLIYYAVAAVLLAGVSPFGRRAGVFGVLFAVMVVHYTVRLELLNGSKSWVAILTSVIYAFVGLLVIWVLEFIGRRVTPLAAAAAVPPPAAPLPPPAPYGLTPPPAYQPAQYPAGPPPVSAPPVSAPPQTHQQPQTHQTPQAPQAPQPQPGWPPAPPAPGQQPGWPPAG